MPPPPPSLLIYFWSPKDTSWQALHWGASQPSKGIFFGLLYCLVLSGSAGTLRCACTGFLEILFTFLPGHISHSLYLSLFPGLVFHSGRIYPSGDPAGKDTEEVILSLSFSHAIITVLCCTWLTTLMTLLFDNFFPVFPWPFSEKNSVNICLYFVGVIYELLVHSSAPICVSPCPQAPARI